VRGKDKDKRESHRDEDEEDVEDHRPKRGYAV
jgi:hypothetical protein